MKRILIAWVFGASIGAASAVEWSLDSYSTGSWTTGTYAGVVGGFLQYTAGGANDRAVSGTVIDVTQAPYNADNTGVSDAEPAIDSAIAAANAGDVVYLPAGTYRIGSGSIGTTGISGITIRGDGMGETILDFDGTAGDLMFIGDAGDSYLWNSPDEVVTTPITKGDTTFAMADTSAFGVGDLVRLEVDNFDSYSLPWLPRAGDELKHFQYEVASTGAVLNLNLKGYFGQITSIVPNTSITLNHPIPFDVPAGTEVRASRADKSAGGIIENVGVEQLTIDGANNTTSSEQGLAFNDAVNCWAFEVEIINFGNRGIQWTSSLHCEMRKCKIGPTTGVGSNRAGVLFNTGCTGILIEDNIISGVYAAIQGNGMLTDSVFSYNFSPNSVHKSSSSPETWTAGPSFTSGHSAHPDHLLWEGNVCSSMFAGDGRGSSSHITFFRNWSTGAQYNSLDSPLAFRSYSGGYIAAMRWSYNATMTGNVLGTAGQGNGGYSFGNPNEGNSGYTEGPVNYYGWEGTLSTRTSDTEGEATLAASTLTWTQATDPIVQTGDTVDVWWTGGERAGVTVGTVAGSVIPFSGGSGDVLPSAATTVYVRHWHPEVFPGIVGSVTTRVTDGDLTVTRTSDPSEDDLSVGSIYTVLFYSDGTYRQLGANGIDAESGNDLTWNSVSGSTPTVSTSVQLRPWLKHQQLDGAVEQTVELVHNYIVSEGQIPSAEDLGADTLPDSLIHNSQPSWWTEDGFSGAWPPVDPDNPPTGNIIESILIPAQYRYMSDLGVIGSAGAAYGGRLRFNGTGSKPVLTDGTGSVPIKTN